MSDDEDIAALVVDNGSGMCKGECCHGMVDTEGNGDHFCAVVTLSISTAQLVGTTLNHF